MSDFILKKATYYYYNLLSEREKELYRIFLYALLNMKPSITLSIAVNNDQVNKVADYIISDRPDIFWYDGAWKTQSRNGRVISVTFPYIYSAAEKERIISQIEASNFYNRLNSLLGTAKSDVQKALILYEFIIRNAEYDSNAARASKEDCSTRYAYAYGMNGVILNRRAVCAGYAKAFQYFATKHNLKCTLAKGRTARGRHAWNMIWLRGNCYYIDATWGDPVFSNAASKDPNYISYDYFCNTTQELMKSHHPIFDVQMPLCTATECNYYEYFGMKESVYSVSGFARQILRALKRGKKKVVVKYSSPQQYQLAKNSLFNQNEIFTAFRMAGLRTDRRITYTMRDENQVLEVNL